MEMIKEENVELELTKEEKLANALAFVNDVKLLKKAKFLYQKELYSKETVENFDESLYTDITTKTFKGYSLLTNEEGQLFFVKELEAEDESPVYAHEVISFADVTDEQMHVLAHYKRPINVVSVVTMVSLLFFTFISLYTIVFGFFEYLANGLSNALLYAFLSCGSALAVCVAALAIIFAKPKPKHGCKCKK